MKNQYVGDIGDYGKYGLLRFLAKNGIKIGINWYLTENDGSSDGKFIYYLNKPAEGKYDPELFNSLGKIAFHPDKTVEMIESAGIIPGAEFYNVLLRSKCLELEKRKTARCLWFNNSILLLNEVELIFADPDNGISYRKNMKTKDSEKYILPEEVYKYYKSGKNVVFYCHKGRRGEEAWDKAKSGIGKYINDAYVLAITYHRGTQRSYIFVLHQECFQKYEKLLKEFVGSAWGKIFSWEPVNKN